MSIYQRFGVTPIINAAGTKSRLGGVRLHPEVVAAMAEAAGASVDMVELQAAASRVIARLTDAEAGFVTSGAAAALTLGAAACLTGSDPALIDRLPFTDGLPNGIVIFRSHRNSYDHAWRAAGARLVEVGLDDRVAGSGVRSLDPWELDAAIDERVVSVAYVANPRDDPPLEMVTRVAHQRGVPVLVDAAAQLPPLANLRSFTARGADLVAFSGGKAIGGPQGSGLLAGRRDLVQAAALNALDLDVHAEHWRPPADFISLGELRGLPRHGIGRGFKVGKEEVVALLVALERFVAGAWEQEALSARADLETLVVRLRDLEAALPALVEEPWGPCLELRFVRPEEASEALRALISGDPPVALDPRDLTAGVLAVDSAGLDAGERSLAAERVVEAVTRLSRGRS